jgi:RHS repeat-associated protein
VTHRYYNSYGNQVGTPPASWPGNKGFVGGTDSKATGLTNLGAREYQPQTEAFISPDSLLNPDDPQDLNAYAYASDNPATDEDPTGQMPCDGDMRCGSSAGDPSSSACSSCSGTITPWTPPGPSALARIKKAYYAFMNSLPWWLSLSCQGCTAINTGLVVGPLGAGLGSLIKAAPEYRILEAFESQILGDAPLLQNMSEPGQIDNLLTTVTTRGKDLLSDEPTSLLEDTPKALVAGRVLAGAGGVISGIGEYNQTKSLGKAAAVGAVDTGINLGSMWAGAEAGAVVGSFIGPEGTLAGGLIGGAVSLGVSTAGSLIGDNVANKIINWF